MQWTAEHCNMVMGPETQGTIERTIYLILRLNDYPGHLIVRARYKMSFELINWFKISERITSNVHDLRRGWNEIETDTDLRIGIHHVSSWRIKRQYVDWSWRKQT